jgi:hypothetical protein
MKAADFLTHPNPTETWIMHVPVVSTAHMHKSDDQKLHTESYETDMNHAVRMFGGLGYLLEIDDLADFEEGYSDAFLHLIETFHNLGFHYLRLDPDGNDLDDLPTFEW